ncbi:MAG: formate dehydrogenase subunit gamma [Limnobacter sp.]|nr:formate dehydrogenase subunit gamma [Limnobacter sp.]
MNKAIRALALCAGLLVATAAPAQHQAPADEPGPQSTRILEATRDDQAQRQQVQPLNNAPVWRAVNSGQAYSTQLPANEGGVLIQPGGEPWRLTRNGPVTQGGGWALVGVLLLIAAFYLYRGKIRLHGEPTGRLIERFTFVERLVHWINAACFVLLGFTGIVMLFGKHLLLPLFGYTLFSWLAILSKTTHNFVGPLFAVTTIVMFATFARDNLPRAYDVKWLKSAGGLLSRKGMHPPSHRFNAGEKLMFWGAVVLLGIIVSITGFVLNFPNFGQGRALMQNAWLIHVVAALLFIAVIFGHIYLGTVGMQGAYDSMRHGYVDEAWAREHHVLWYDDIKAGKIPAVRSQEPEGAPVVGPQAASKA